MRLCVNAVLVLLLAVTWARADPTADPTASHTASPTASHTASPTASHTADPTASHTADPTASHTASPTAGSHPEPEECSKLEVLKDMTQFLGEFHFLAGFVDDSLAKTLLGLTTSVWANITETQNGSRIDQFMRMNGTCLETKADVIMIGGKATVSMHGVVSHMQLLNFSINALIMDLSISSSNITQLIEKIHLDPHIKDDHTDSLKAHSVYLIGRENVLSDDDMNRFIDYAKCAGFTRDPDFIHKSDKEDCREEESELTTDD